MLRDKSAGERDDDNWQILAVFVSLLPEVKEAFGW
jgi:hypothetical protein